MVHGATGDNAMANPHLGAEHDSIFLRTPFALFDAGIKVVEPPLTALLAYPARKPGRNDGPLHLHDGKVSEKRSQGIGANNVSSRG